MPNGNGTGPVGAEPKAGRGMGRCAGNEAPGWQTGLGRGRGIQRGRCRNRMQSGDAAGMREEMEALRMQLIALGQKLAENRA